MCSDRKDGGGWRGFDAGPRKLVCVFTTKSYLIKSLKTCLRGRAAIWALARLGLVRSRARFSALSLNVESRVGCKRIQARMQRGCSCSGCCIAIALHHKPGRTDAAYTRQDETRLAVVALQGLSVHVLSATGRALLIPSF